MQTHVRAHSRHATLSSMDARLSRLEKHNPTIPPLPLPEGANDLPVQVSIIVPSTKEESKPLTETEFEQRINDEKKWWDTRFGGDTTIQDVGSYVYKGKVINEKGAIVQASMSMDKYRKYRGSIAQHASKKQKDWSQHTILINVEGRTFITPAQNEPGWDNDKVISPEIKVN